MTSQPSYLDHFCSVEVQQITKEHSSKYSDIYSFDLLIFSNYFSLLNWNLHILTFFFQIDSSTASASTCSSQTNQQKQPDSYTPETQPHTASIQENKTTNDEVSMAESIFTKLGINIKHHQMM